MNFHERRVKTSPHPRTRVNLLGAMVGMRPDQRLTCSSPAQLSYELVSTCVRLRWMEEMGLGCQRRVGAARRPIKFALNIDAGLHLVAMNPYPDVFHHSVGSLIG